jgi:hypothetical protein
MNPYVLALDLGPAADFTALAVLQHEANEPRTLAVRHLQRFPPGTSYSTISEVVGATVRDGGLGHPPLIADLTAVGSRLLLSLRDAVRPAWVVPVVLTAGQTPAKDADGIRRVPKRDLVTNLQLHLQERRLRVAPALPEAALLVRELTAFRAKVSLAETDALDWRERPSDDLVLAVALGAWWAVEHPVGGGHLYGADATELMTFLDRLFPELARPETPIW